MKYFVITDSTDTQVGLRLAGIEGVVVREEPLVRAAIQTAAADAAQAHGQGSAYVLEALGDTASRRGGLRRADGGGAAADAHHAGQYQEGEEGGQA